ncbi:MAG TPA: MATE family efflux transporter [Azospirillaceae bacterium]|nr:MATE family efflux transporter [Azospirillaceae bacterium]
MHAETADRHGSGPARPVAPPGGEMTTARTLRLATPLMLAGALTPILSLFDTWVVAVLPETYYLGAVAVGTMMFNYCYWAFAFLRMSTAGLAAQAWGARDPVEVKLVLVRGCVLALGLGGVIALAAALLVGPAAHALSSSPEVEENARLYILARIWSVPAAFLNYALMGWFLAQRRMALSTAIEVLRSAANVALGIVIVRGLGYGVEGVAFAAALAEHVALAVALVAGWRMWRADRSPWSWRQAFAWRPFRRVMEVSRDLFIRSQCLLLAFLGFTAGSGAFGDTTLAANALLMNLYLLVSYILSAFSQVASATVGSAVGARDPDGVVRAIRVTTNVSVWAAVFCAAVMMLCGGVFIDALTPIESVRMTAREYLPYAAILPLVAVPSFQLDGAAIGAALTGLLRNTLVLALVIYAAGYWILPGWVGNHGVWIAFSAFMGARSIGFFVSLPTLRRAAG